jgi:hypothetical protein
VSALDWILWYAKTFPFSTLTTVAVLVVWIHALRRMKTGDPR